MPMALILLQILALLVLVLPWLPRFKLNPVILPVAAGCLFGALWWVVLRPVPHDWLGLMDGYLYQMFIKHYAGSWGLGDWTGEATPTYPPMFFYLAGRIAGLLGATDFGQVYKWCFILSYGTAPLLAYGLLRFALKPELAAYASCLLPLVYIGFDFAHIAQKPHEITTLSLLIPATLLFLSPKFAECSVRVRALCGAVIGLAFGMHTAFLIGIMFGGILLLGGMLTLPSQRTAGIALVHRAFEKEFLLPLLLCAAPWFLTYMRGVIQYGHGPHVTFTNLSETTLWFMELGWQRLPIFVGLFAVAAYAASGKFSLEKLTGRTAVLFLALPLLLTLILLLQKFGIYQTSALIHAAIAFHLSGLFLFVWANDTEDAPKGSAAALKALVLLGIMIYPTDFYTSITQHEMYKRSLDISNGRNNNGTLQKIKETLENDPAVPQQFVYLANSETRFLNFYLKTKTAFPALYYNHTYASAYEPRAEYLAQLKAAIESDNPEEFLDFLTALNVSVLMMTDYKDKGGYNFFFENNSKPGVFHGHTNQKSEEYLVPRHWGASLTNHPDIKVLYQDPINLVLLNTKVAKSSNPGIPGYRLINRGVE